ncbi:MAG TPA: TIM barrel protein [Candidatus Margulisiibacteriota bacterium]|nr:TIM barrel protein [Candidatus Margulisiibacteriota bacterium]
MRPALHIDPPLASIPEILRHDGVDAFQTTLRNPQRFGKEGIPDAADQASYLAGATGLWGIAHATLLVNLASPEGRIRNASAASLLGDLQLAARLGLAGVCFHVGYAKGHPDMDSALTAAARKLTQVLESMPAGACAVIENSCEGTELGKEIAEIGRLVRDVGAPSERLAVLIDTCHLHAAGFDLTGAEAGNRLADALQAEGILDRVLAFHLNDSQGPCGCKRDRHAVPGEGTIHAGLLSVVGHGAFADLPMILELSIDEARRGMAYLKGS